MNKGRGYDDARAELLQDDEDQVQLGGHPFLEEDGAKDACNELIWRP